MSFLKNAQEALNKTGKCEKKKEYHISLLEPCGFFERKYEMDAYRMGQHKFSTDFFF